MSNTAQTTATKRVPMDSTRKTALVAGVLYLITFVSSIPALLLIQPVRNDPNYILGAGTGGRGPRGRFLAMLTARAAAGTAGRRTARPRPTTRISVSRRTSTSSPVFRSA